MNTKLMIRNQTGLNYPFGSFLLTQRKKLVKNLKEII